MYVICKFCFIIYMNVGFKILISYIGYGMYIIKYKKLIVIGNVVVK